jgi:SAM-dependent methyltransferase
MPARLIETGIHALNLEKILCPVCGSDSFTLLFKKQEESFVCCDSCTLVFINPRRAPAGIQGAYDHHYSGCYAIKGKKKLRRCRRWVSRVRRRFGGNGRWLDIGCSVGYVVLAAKEAGYDAYGIDVEPWGLDHGRTQLHLENLLEGTLEEQQFPDHFFNVISLYDVIEHLPDLNSLAAELKRILAPGGVIDIITPDIGHWRVPRALDTWSEIKPSEHLFYFSFNTLSRLLNKHGLKIVKKRFHIKPALRVYVQHTG